LGRKRNISISIDRNESNIKGKILLLNKFKIEYDPDKSVNYLTNSNEKKNKYSSNSKNPSLIKKSIYKNKNATNNSLTTPVKSQQKQKSIPKNSTTKKNTETKNTKNSNAKNSNIKNSNFKSTQNKSNSKKKDNNKSSGKKLSRLAKNLI
jgi:hypothetical protein